MQLTDRHAWACCTGARLANRVVAHHIVELDAVLEAQRIELGLGFVHLICRCNKHLALRSHNGCSDTV